jgi:O-acetylhomoserine (thiol)-lyase
MPDWGFETRQVHAGAVPDPTTGARAVPIYQTTSYTFRDTSHAAALFGLEELGNIYTRIMNPTQAVFEERIAALEGGVAALAVASGQAAETITLLNLAENGGHIVSSASLYGGTYNLFHYTLPKLGIEVTFIDDPDDLEAWRRGRSDRTPRRSSPRRSATRRATCSTSRASRRSPTITRSRSSSTTRWRRRTCPTLAPRCRHRRALGHQVHRWPRDVHRRRDRRRREVRLRGERGRFPNFTEPDPSYHGLVFGKLPEALFPARFVLKARLQYLRDTGPADRAAQLVPVPPGLETLSLRMERHVQNATAVANWLEARDEVSWVAYPGLDSSRWHDDRRSTCPTAAVRSSRSALPAAQTRDATSSRVSNCSATWPMWVMCGAWPSTRPRRRTRQLTEAEQTTTGVTPDLVRLSVGIESIEDILADLDAGFRAAKGA